MVVGANTTRDLDVARRTLREGATDFVAKPFDLARVGTVIDAVLAARG